MPNSRNKWKSESNTAVERRRDQWMVWSPSGQETNLETGTNETQQSFTVKVNINVYEEAFNKPIIFTF